MPSGACGINCDVCRLNLKGTCSTCGPGTSAEAARKLAAQERILNAPCPILACAHLNQIGYCMRDCPTFPCENFSSGPYPYSSGFLDMQQRRLKEGPKAYAPDGSHLTVADEYWQEVSARDATDLCNLTLFDAITPDRFQFRFLNQEIQIDIARRRLLHHGTNGQWSVIEDPLLALITVVYLKNVKIVYPLGKDIVGCNDLKEGHFFTGPHELRTEPLLRRYGNDLNGFSQGCQALDGKAMQMADAAFKLLPFPRLPLYLLLWLGDAEFKPRLQVLFDRYIEEILPADAIWALVNRVSMAFAET